MHAQRDSAEQRWKRLQGKLAELDRAREMHSEIQDYVARVDRKARSGLLVSTDGSRLPRASVSGKCPIFVMLAQRSEAGKLQCLRGHQQCISSCAADELGAVWSALN